MEDFFKCLRKKTSVFVVAMVLFTSVLLTVKAVTLTEEGTDGIKLEQGSELTYYIDISYDGVDVKGVESNDKTIADVYSGYIYVEDKIPDGLEFVGFVSDEFGAVDRDTGKSCSGRVENGTLNYNATTRTVSFKVRNLKAGCVLTVGVTTKTPTLAAGQRKDFYNFAVARENAQTVISNTVHAYVSSMSAEEEAAVPKHKVTYQYDGTYDFTPVIPPEMSYIAGSVVPTGTVPNVEGYTFNGWTINGTPVTGDSFIMPDGDVVLVGSFTPNPKYNVTYKLGDGSFLPPSYVLPTDKEYYGGTTVPLDGLKKGDIIDGYIFGGWTSPDVEISHFEDENGNITGSSFVTGDKNVTIVGLFEPIKYTLKYEYYDAPAGVLPPAGGTYVEGDTIYFPDVPEVPGYNFLGWYEDDTDGYKMPGDDVTIYGEWVEQTGVFEPTISKEIINPKPLYVKGDVVEFKITITNPAPFPIKDVYIRENHDKAIYTGTSCEEYQDTDLAGYCVVTDHVTQIPVVEPNGTIVIYGKYEVTDEESGPVVSESELVGATADGNYNLDDTKDYKAPVEFTIYKPDSQVKPVPNPDDSPNTGDTSGSTLIIALVSLGILLAYLIFFIITRINKKKKESNKADSEETKTDK